MTKQRSEIEVSLPVYIGVLAGLFILQIVALMLNVVLVAVASLVGIVYWIVPYIMSGISLRKVRG
jgi:hypothetical protein